MKMLVFIAPVTSCLFWCHCLFRLSGMLRAFFFAYSGNSDARTVYAKVLKFFVIFCVFIFLLWRCLLISLSISSARIPCRSWSRAGLLLANLFWVSMSICRSGTNWLTAPWWAPSFPWLVQRWRLCLMSGGYPYSVTLALHGRHWHVMQAWRLCLFTGSAIIQSLMRLSGCSVT